MDPSVIFSLTISGLALIVSGATAWLTLFRKGKVRMTQPAVIYFGPDGGSGEPVSPKIYLRTLLYSTSRRGRLVQSMYVTARRGETAQSFNIWVYGDEGLRRGSGLFVGYEGVASNHHFLLPSDGTTFEFLPGRYRLDVYASLVGDRSERRLWSVSLELPERESSAIREDSKGAYFDWGPDSKSYHAHAREIPRTALSGGLNALFSPGVELGLSGIGEAISSPGMAAVGGPSPLFEASAQVRLLLTPECGELSIWSRPMGKTNVSGADRLTAVFAKPHFVYIRVKNHGARNLENLNAEILIDGTVDKTLGQWVVEATGDFVADQVDGIPLKVGLERVLLLALAFPEKEIKRWYRVEPGTPKRFYLDSTAAIASGRAFDQNPISLEVHLRAEGVHEAASFAVRFDSEGQPALEESPSP